MIKYLLALSTYAIFLISSCVSAIVLPDVITSNMTMSAGVHVISNSTHIPSGIQVDFLSGSTVQCINANSSLTIEGVLFANDTLFMGASTNDRWGHVFTLSGSTANFTQCTFNKGGGSDFPPQDMSNGVLLVRGGEVSLTHSAFTLPAANTIALTGGRLNCISNELVAYKRQIYSFAGIHTYSNSTPIYLLCKGNITTNIGGYDGIVIDGTYRKNITVDSTDMRIHAFDVHISNSTFKVMPGTHIGFYDYLPGLLTVDNNGEFWACGTESNPIILSNFYNINPWRINLLPRSKAYLNDAYVYELGVFNMSNAYLCISNTYFSQLNNGINIYHQSEVCAYDTIFSGIINYGLRLQNTSTGLFRRCQFTGNNVPFIKTMNVYGTSFVDARYCWWDSPTGPRPFGDGELVTVTDKTFYHPWLLGKPSGEVISDITINNPSIDVTSYNTIAFDGVYSLNGSVSETEISLYNNGIELDAPIYANGMYYLPGGVTLNADAANELKASISLADGTTVTAMHTVVHSSTAPQDADVPSVKILNPSVQTTSFTKISFDGAYSLNNGVLSAFELYHNGALLSPFTYSDGIFNVKDGINLVSDSVNELQAIVTLANGNSATAQWSIVQDVSASGSDANPRITIKNPNAYTTAYSEIAFSGTYALNGGVLSAISLYNNGYELMPVEYANGIFSVQNGIVLSTNMANMLTAIITLANGHADTDTWVIVHNESAAPGDSKPTVHINNPNALTTAYAHIAFNGEYNLKGGILKSIALYNNGNKIFPVSYGRDFFTVQDGVNLVADSANELKAIVTLANGNAATDSWTIVHDTASVSSNVFPDISITEPYVLTTRYEHIDVEGEYTLHCGVLSSLRLWHDTTEVLPLHCSDGLFRSADPVQLKSNTVNHLQAIVTLANGNAATSLWKIVHNPNASQGIYITKPVTYRPGIYYFDDSIIITPSGSLTFEPASTAIFTFAEGSICNYGILNIEGTTITPENLDNCWGHIFTYPGSTTTINNCLLDSGGGSTFPPTDSSNGVLYTLGGNVSLTHSTFIEPTGNSIAICGGQISCITNDLVAHKRQIYPFAGIQTYSISAPIDLLCTGNVTTNINDGHGGIVIGGMYTENITVDSPDMRIHVFDVHISNCVFKVLSGTEIGFYDYLPGTLTLDNNARFYAEGTADNQIILSNFYGKNPWKLRLLSHSKAYLNHAYVYELGVFDMSNAYLCISNTYFSELNNGININHQSEISAYDTIFSGIINVGIYLQYSSTGLFRRCQFTGNNAPYIKTLNVDETSYVDARYCWWDSPTGPRPYGDGELVMVTDNTFYYPWLLGKPSDIITPYITINNPSIGETPYNTVSFDGTYTLNGGISTPSIHLYNNGRDLGTPIYANGMYYIPGGVTLDTDATNELKASISLANGTTVTAMRTVIHNSTTPQDTYVPSVEILNPSVQTTAFTRISFDGVYSLNNGVLSSFELYHNGALLSPFTYSDGIFNVKDGINLISNSVNELKAIVTLANGNAATAQWTIVHDVSANIDDATPNITIKNPNAYTTAYSEIAFSGTYSLNGGVLSSISLYNNGFDLMPVKYANGIFNVHNGIVLSTNMANLLTAIITLANGHADTDSWVIVHNESAAHDNSKPAVNIYNPNALTTAYTHIAFNGEYSLHGGALKSIALYNNGNKIFPVSYGRDFFTAQDGINLIADSANELKAIVTLANGNAATDSWTIVHDTASVSSNVIPDISITKPYVVTTRYEHIDVEGEYTLNGGVLSSLRLWHDTIEILPLHCSDGLFRSTDPVQLKSNTLNHLQAVVTLANGNAATSIWKIVYDPNASQGIYITESVIYRSGTYYFDDSVFITPSGSLTFEPGSTAIFTFAEGSICNYGILNMDGATITPENSDNCWGHIFTYPGSTTTINNCLLDSGGGSTFPPSDSSNGVLYTLGGNVSLTHSTFIEPTGNSIAICGGQINCITNWLVAHQRLIYKFSTIQIFGTSTSIDLLCTGNVTTNINDGHGGIVIGGMYTEDITIDSPDMRINAFDIHISNCTFQIMPGTHIGFYDYLPGTLTLDNNAQFHAEGTADSRIILSNYFGTNPWKIRLLSHSKAYFNHAYICNPAVFNMSNAYLCISNTYFAQLDNGINVDHKSELRAFASTFKDIVNVGVDILNSSTGIFRQCQFIDNNVPYIKTLESDETSFIDARLCWWGASDGPYPYGAYGNEYVNTNNTTIYVFPWLLAVPGTQDNPPLLTIETPLTDPYITPDSQFLMEGTAYDETGIDRVIYRTFRSQFSANASFRDATWWNAETWLFEGINQIGVYAFDSEGNSTVASLLVDCTGVGSGTDKTHAPQLLKLMDRKVKVGETVTFAIAAVSPREPAIISYWAGIMPAGAYYNASTHTFTWTPIQETVENVSFYATDGTYTNKETVTITVTDDPQPIVLVPDIPKAYEYKPFFMWLIADNCEFPVKWQHSDLSMRAIPSGMAVSRSGLIGGIPTSMNSDMRINFITTAIDAQYEYSDDHPITIDVLDATPPEIFEVTSTDIPVIAQNTDVQIQLTATNGIPPYTWRAVDSRLNECGLTLAEEGILTGQANNDGLFSFYAVATDATNKSTAAYITVPVIDGEDELKYITDKNKFKAVIKRKFGKTQKCSFMFKAMVVVPNSLSLADDDVLTVRVGDLVLDLTKVDKFVAGKKVMMKFMRAQGGEKIKALLKQMPDGTMKVKFIWKKMDLGFAFEQYGVVDEEREKIVTIPVWLRVSDGMTTTEERRAEVKSKVGKVTRVKAQW